MITMFMGENVEQMSREKLIEAVRILGTLLDQQHKATRLIIDMNNLRREMGR